MNNSLNESLHSLTAIVPDLLMKGQGIHSYRVCEILDTASSLI